MKGGQMLMYVQYLKTKDVTTFFVVCVLEFYLTENEQYTVDWHLRIYDRFWKQRTYI
jgi:hypothetical protein